MQPQMHCKPHATNIQLNQNTCYVKYAPQPASVILSKHGYTLWAGYEAKLSDRMRESFKTTSGEACICVYVFVLEVTLCEYVPLHICACMRVSVHPGAPEIAL